MRSTLLTTLLFIALLLAGCAGTPASVSPTSADVQPNQISTSAFPTPILGQDAPTTTPVPPDDTPVLLAPATPAPTLAAAAIPATGQPARLVIDAIGLDQSLLPVGLDQRRMPIVPEHDVGWYVLSAQPGQGENVVLWGHVLRFRSAPDIPAPFADLKNLREGDRVTLFDSQGNTYAYTVAQQVWAAPQQIEYMLPTGREQLTLISCIGEKVIADGAAVDMTHRLITIAVPD